MALIDQTFQDNTSIATVEIDDTAGGNFLVGSDADFYLNLVWYNQYIAIPLICSVGIIGSGISFIVVVYSGIKTPSQIFLSALAVADFLTLIEVVDVAKYLYLQPGTCTTSIARFELPEEKSVIVTLVLQIVIFCVSAFGGRMSTSITALITIERLIAVFLPLKFSLIVTHKRAWVALAGAALFWLPWSIYQGLWNNLNYSFNQQCDSYTGWLSSSRYYKTPDFDVLFFNDTVVSQPTHTIPLLVVIVGSLLTGIKVSLERRRRLNILSARKTQKTSYQTTKILLMVCLVYSLTRLYAMLRYLPQFQPLTTNRFPWNTVYRVTRARFLNLNSACNSVIYFACHAKFRRNFRHLFCKSKTAKRVHFRK